MRCPKCGYISFDHLEKCLRCSKDIKAISSGLFGSTYNVQAPNFLKLNEQLKENPSNQMDHFEGLAYSDEEEYVDEELEILVEDETPEIEGGIDLAENEQDEDEEIEIDFSQFENDDDPEVDLLSEDEFEEKEPQEKVVTQSEAMETPEEFSDMPGLTPPESTADGSARSSEQSADSELDDMDLEDFDFDLGLDDLDGESTIKPEEAKETLLALDEIDFSETLAESDKKTSKMAGDEDMEDDFDFDLDLGGLSIHNEA